VIPSPERRYSLQRRLRATSRPTASISTKGSPDTWRVVTTHALVTAIARPSSPDRLGQRTFRPRGQSHRSRGKTYESPDRRPLLHTGEPDRPRAARTRLGCAHGRSLPARLSRKVYEHTSSGSTPAARSSSTRWSRTAWFRWGFEC